MQRPLLNKTISVDDFKNHYWLKEELAAFCKEVRINRVGGKLDLATRIELYLKTGTVTTKVEQHSSKSKFDWN